MAISWFLARSHFTKIKLNNKCCFSICLWHHAFYIHKLNMKQFMLANLLHMQSMNCCQSFQIMDLKTLRWVALKHATENILVENNNGVLFFLECKCQYKFIIRLMQQPVKQVAIHGLVSIILKKYYYFGQYKMENTRQPSPA